MCPEIGSLSSSDYFSLSFPYDEVHVRNIRALKRRRWNKEQQYWEVHLTHLSEVMQLFGLSVSDVDRKLYRLYQIHQIRNAQVRIEVGHVMTCFHGTTLPVDRIDAATSFFVPGYQYMPLFMQGKWDGRKHLLNRRKMTLPTGLLPRALAILDSMKIEYELEEQTPPEEEEKGNVKLAKPDVELRAYQRTCVRAALKAKRGVLELATGSGKTAIATWMIHKLKRPALFFVHTRDLLHQTREYMQQQLGVEIGQIGDGVIDIRPVTVATVQTCARALDIHLKTTSEDEPLEEDATEVQSRAQEIAQTIAGCPVVFFDECHHLPAETCYALSMRCEAAAWRFGLSATPYRSDRLDMLLEAALGAKLYRANASTLIRKGYLVAPSITFLPVPSLRVSGMRPQYPLIFEDYIVNNARRNSMIANEARALAAGGKSVLILVSQIRHGEALAELLPGAVLVQGSDLAEQRRRIFVQLERKERLLVIATTLADEGLDIPSLDALILASGGKSETRALQRLGRALRTAPGKAEALVFDFLDDAPYLKEHSLKRLELFRSEPEFKVGIRGKDENGKGQG